MVRRFLSRLEITEKLLRSPAPAFAASIVKKSASLTVKLTSNTFRVDVYDISGFLIRSDFYFTNSAKKNVLNYSKSFNVPAGTLKSVTMPFYEKINSDGSIALVRASQAGLNARRSFSVSFDNTITNAQIASATLATIEHRTSITGFAGAAGVEVNDYAVYYRVGTQDVTGVSVRIYEGGVRAVNAAPNSKLIQSIVFDPFLDLSQLPSVDASTVQARMAVNFYAGERGNEIHDYTLKYKTGTDELKEVSVLFYERALADGTKILVRAIAALPGDRVAASIAFDPWLPISQIEVVTLDTLVGRKSITFYAGDNLVDYARVYRTGTDEIASIKFNYYGPKQLRAANATSRLLTRQDSFDNKLDLSSAEPNPLNRISSTFYANGSGQSIADYIYNYQVGTETVKSVSVKYYDGDVRAINASPWAKVVRVDAWEVRNINQIPASNKRVSSTYYAGEQGDEVADYIIKYKTGTPDIESVSVRVYDGNKRAIVATTADKLIESWSYSRNLDLATLAGGAALTNAERQSITYYAGERGDEVADYTKNFKTGTDELKGVAVSLYGTYALRAINATSSDKLVESWSYGRNLDLTTIADGAALTLTERQSITYYAGDRQPDYVYTFKTGTDWLRSISVNYYGAGQMRAADAVSGVLTRKDAHHTSARVDGINIFNRLSSTFYTNASGRNIANYIYHYKLGTELVQSVSLEYYGSDMRRAATADPDAFLTRRDTWAVGDISQIPASNKRTSSSYFVRSSTKDGDINLIDYVVLYGAAANGGNLKRVYLYGDNNERASAEFSSTFVAGDLSRIQVNTMTDQPVDLLIVGESGNQSLVSTMTQDLTDLGITAADLGFASIAKALTWTTPDPIMINVDVKNSQGQLVGTFYFSTKIYGEGLHLDHVDIFIDSIRARINKQLKTPVAVTSKASVSDMTAQVKALLSASPTPMDQTQLNTLAEMNALTDLGSSSDSYQMVPSLNTTKRQTSIGSVK